ncbi:MAG: permease, glycerol uptake facilitator [Actinobacteria bacterium]|nr:permease, glycerol uptake facilitator [Actinomycetota bacterium]
MQVKRAIAMEFLGSAILAVAIVGSGFMAANTSTDNGIRLFINALATALGLAVVIRIGLKISGSHFNPAVSLVMLILKKITPKLFALYLMVQTIGAIFGTLLANLIFDQKLIVQSQIYRDGSNLLISETFATLVLLWIILRFPKRDDLIAIYAPLWIFGAIIFTSSTSFANPAITIGRIFTSSIVGISPSSAFAFILAQLIGAVLGLLISKQVTNPGKDSDE